MKKKKKLRRGGVGKFWITGAMRQKAASDIHEYEWSDNGFTKPCGVFCDRHRGAGDGGMNDAAEDLEDMIELNAPWYIRAFCKHCKRQIMTGMRAQIGAAPMPDTCTDCEPRP